MFSASRINQRGFLARLPANWREIVEGLAWWSGWEPRVFREMTPSELLRWNDAAKRLGPRLVKAAIVRLKE